MTNDPLKIIRICKLLSIAIILGLGYLMMSAALYQDLAPVPLEIETRFPQRNEKPSQVLSLYKEDTELASDVLFPAFNITQQNCTYFIDNFQRLVAINNVFDTKVRVLILEEIICNMGSECNPILLLEEYKSMKNTVQEGLNNLCANKIQEVQND